MRYVLGVGLALLVGCQDGKNAATGTPKTNAPPAHNTPAAAVQAKTGESVAEATAPNPTPTNPFSEGIDLSFAEWALDQGVTSTSFDFLQIRDLWVRVKVAGMEKIVTLQLNFISPTGSTFYSMSQLYTPDPSVTTGIMNNVPSSALLAKAMTGGYALDYPVPISGTVFQRYPTPGAWTVKASVDGTTLTTPLQVTYGP
jgi:hypothetical protein